MRVLFVSSSSGSRGGGEFFLLYLAEALKSEGLEVGLWLSREPEMDGIAERFAPLGEVLRGPYRNTYRRKSRSFSHLFPSDRVLAPICEQWSTFRPDILHLNKQCLEDGLDLLEGANTFPVAQGCTLHITQTAVELKAFLGGLRDAVARRALRRYRGGLWAIARNRAEALQAFVGEGRAVSCIPNGVRIPTEAEMIESARQGRATVALAGQDGPVAVSVGRLEPQKDPMRFLEIMALWKARDAGLSAVWVGDGGMRAAFEERIAAMGAKDWITCVGWQESAHPFLAMADVYVHPARFEGLPFALLEAMAHGLPCVISPELAADLKDIPAETWILAGADEADWLAQLADRNGLEQRGRETRELAIQSFSLQAMARAYVDLYQRMLRERGPDPS